MRMASESIVEWEKRRAALSHDILKNEITPAVFKLCNILFGRVEDPDFDTAFATSTGPKIERLCAELEELAQNAEHALSPRQYCDQEPLLGVDEETRRWLPEVIHLLWIHRVDLSKQVQGLSVSAGRVRESLARMNAGLGAPPSASLERDARDLLESLHGLAIDLSAMANLLPYRR